MTTQLPDNDPDLLLARQFGQLLEEGRSPDSLDDPLIRELSAYRLRRQRILEDEVPNSEQLWKQIEGKTSESNVTPLPWLGSSAVRWAAAAVVLLVALIGIGYLQFWQGPELVAKSGAAIETVQLADGSSVTLRPHSKLFQLTETGTQYRYRITGEAYFEVTTNPSRNFVVEAGRGRVSVLGTKFTLSSWGEITRVFLEEGSIRFAGPEESEGIILEPGQSSTLADDQATPELQEGDPTQYTDWLRNELVFNNSSAGQIFEEVEQHFNIIIQAPATIRTDSLSGSVALQDEEATLNYLGLSLGGSFTKTGSQTYTFVANENN